MPPLSTALAQGIALFNGAKFYEAHDVWESAWRSAAMPEKQLLGGLIQFAAALHQARRGKNEGATKLFARAATSLSTLPSEVLGLDVNELELLLQRAQEAHADGALAGVPLQIAGGASSGDAGDAFRAAQCPYCGETVEVRADSVGPSSESYVEDCSVCCRPWVVSIAREGGEVEVSLTRDSD